jgi:hypothetical protein
MISEDRAIHMAPVAAASPCDAGSPEPTAPRRVIVPLGQLRTSRMAEQALAIVVEDLTITPLARSCAHQLWHALPASNELGRTWESNSDAPQQWLQSMLEAEAFLRVLFVWGQGTASTRRILEATLRCLPDHCDLGAHDGDRAGLCKLLIERTVASTCRIPDTPGGQLR